MPDPSIDRPPQSRQWGPEELAFLHSLVLGSRPSRAVAAYNAWAESHGYPIRTKRQLINVVCRRLGCDFTPPPTQGEVVPHAGGYRWSQPEQEMLLSLAGDMPLPMVIASYNGWASQHGYPERSRAAIRSVIRRFQASTLASGSWLTPSTVAALLGVHSKAVWDWERRFQAITFRSSCGHKARPGERGFLIRKDLRQMARSNPHLLAGFDRTALFLLLEDEALADELSQRPRAVEGPTTIPRPVRHLDTGRVYPTIRAASRGTFIDPGSIRRSLRLGRPNAAGAFELLAAA